MRKTTAYDYSESRNASTDATLVNRGERSGIRVLDSRNQRAEPLRLRHFGGREPCPHVQEDCRSSLHPQSRYDRVQLQAYGPAVGSVRSHRANGRDRSRQGCALCHRRALHDRSGKSKPLFRNRPRPERGRSRCLAGRSLETPHESIFVSG